MQMCFTVVPLQVCANFFQGLEFICPQGHMVLTCDLDFFFFGKVFSFYKVRIVNVFIFYSASNFSQMKILGACLFFFLNYLILITTARYLILEGFFFSSYTPVVQEEYNYYGFGSLLNRHSDAEEYEGIKGVLGGWRLKKRFDYNYFFKIFMILILP